MQGAGAWARVASLLTAKSQADWNRNSNSWSIAVKGSEPAYTADSETFEWYYLDRRK